MLKLLSAPNWHRATDLPAGMGPIAGPELVAESQWRILSFRMHVCSDGRQVVRKTYDLTDKPFGVDLIRPPNRPRRNQNGRCGEPFRKNIESSARYRQQLELIMPLYLRI